MLYRKNGEWKLCSHKLKYEQFGKQYETYAHDLNWWEEFVSIWSHTKIISIENVIYTEEQLSRYEQIKYLPEDFGHVYSVFVENGEIINDEYIVPNHPLRLVLLSGQKVPTIEADISAVAETAARVLIDTNEIAEFASFLLIDSTFTAEALANVLEKNIELENRIKKLEGGK